MCFVWNKQEKEVSNVALSKEFLIQMLQIRGYTHLRTKLGIKPLTECPENQLNGVYNSGKYRKRAERPQPKKEKQYEFNF